MRTREFLGLATLALALLLGAPEVANAQSYEILHAFSASTDPAVPEAGLIEANDGNLYGTVRAGGAYGDGAVFRMSLSGTVETVYSFHRGGDRGAMPRAPLIQGTDGNFYGKMSVAADLFSFAPIFRLTPEG
jgi:uncharacterized repeat protein (TIGR03803 family)